MANAFSFWSVNRTVHGPNRVSKIEKMLGARTRPALQSLGGRASFGRTQSLRAAVFAGNQKVTVVRW